MNTHFLSESFSNNLEKLHSTMINLNEIKTNKDNIYVRKPRKQLGRKIIHGSDSNAPNMTYNIYRRSSLRQHANRFESHSSHYGCNAHCIHRKLCDLEMC
jgi:hypothetical protein